MVRSLDRQDAVEGELVDFVCEEFDSFKAGLGLGGASDKCGVVFDAVVIDKITEREAISEEDGLYGSGFGRSFVIVVERVEFCGISVSVLLIIRGV